MRSNKAIQLLQTFDDLELGELKNYLRKQYSRDSLAFKIFDYFYQKKEHFIPKPEWISIEVAYKKICKKEIEPKGRKVFLNTTHLLHKSIQQFLLSKELEKDSFEKDQLLNKIYRERKLYKTASLIIQVRKNKIANSAEKNIWHPLQKFQMDYQAYFENKEGKMRDHSTTLSNMMQTLDTFFCTFKLLLSYEMTNRKNLFSEQYEIPFLEEVVHYVEEHLNIDTINPQFYAICLNVISTRTEKSLKKLVSFLDTYQKYISLDNIKLAFSVQLNTWIHLNRKKVKKAPEQIFLLYKNGLKNDYFLFEGYLRYTTFLNIVTIACLVKEHEWCRKFIKDYQHLITPKYQHSTINLSTASLLFAEDRFDNMLSYLNHVEFTDLIFSVRAKSLILRAYYELQSENRELLLNYCKSFKTFLENNQHINPRLMNGYLLLIENIRIFYRKNTGYTKAELIQKIINEENPSFQEWLLRKAKALKTRQYRKP